MLDFKIIKVAIGRSYPDAYAFLADARNFAEWGGSDPGTAVVALGGNDWRIEVNGQTLVLRYVSPNPFGILDFQAFRQGDDPGRATPVRLSPNQDGCELVYSHFRQPGLTDEQFASAAQWLEADLLRLKSFLERDYPAPPMLASTIISLGIERPVAQVQPYLAEPRKYSEWAAVTSDRLKHLGGFDWLADTAAGPRIIRFSEPNDFGVVDHAVFAEGETPLVNPARVVANGAGTLMTYTCFQRPGMSAEKYESTIEWITSDFLVLKSLLEV